MNLFLQFGYGMKAHCSHLIDKWGGGCAILSPRDLDDAQLRRTAGEVGALKNGHVLLDPQFYLPAAEHRRLTAHTYWPESYSTGTFWSGGELSAMIQKLATINVQLGTEAIILPGVCADEANHEWLGRQKDIAVGARSLLRESRLYSTISLSSDVVRSEDQIHEILEELDHWPVNGVYIVAAHPAGQYLIDDPIWLANLMDLCAGIRLRGLSCIVGYSNHQLLLLALAGVTAIASGTWLNVRSFSTEKFNDANEDDKKRKSTWYYCPGSLSEYKMSFLDQANKMGVLGTMRPKPSLGSNYADVLFAGAQPTTVVAFGESDAFRHYLQCLHAQSGETAANTYHQSRDALVAQLEAATSLTKALQRQGVRGQERDFSSAIDANLAAIALFDKVRGAQMSASWSAL